MRRAGGARSHRRRRCHGGHPKAGAASRPIAGKRGSHRLDCAGLEAGDLSVGAGLPAMRPVLTTGRWHGVRHGAFAVIYDRQLSTRSGPYMPWGECGVRMCSP